MLTCIFLLTFGLLSFLSSRPPQLSSLLIFQPLFSSATMMSSNTKSHRIRNKKKCMSAHSYSIFLISHLADLEIICLVSNTTQDTDNSQPAAPMMAPSNEPLSQREY